MKDVKAELILNTLDKFYNIPKNNKILVDIITNKKYAKRVIEWFVSNYSKKKNIIYQLRKKDFDVYHEYKIQLKSYSKEYFDPFRRKNKLNEKFIFKISSVKIETTIGQLNFFKWAIENKIVDYVILNYNAIKEDMKKTLEKNLNKGQKRKRLCENAKRVCLKEYNKVTIKFN